MSSRSSRSPRSLPIRWRLTLWYGAVLAGILLLVSLAGYLRYRSAAWRAFDADLVSNLDGVRGALQEELKEALAAPPDASAPSDGLGPLRHAAEATLDEFRLSGFDAEVRAGEDARIPLARTAGLSRTLFPEAIWARLARSAAATILDAGEGRRCAVRVLSPGAALQPVTVALADRTSGVEQTLGSIRRSLVGIGLAGLSLALLGGYWLATRALAPIDSLTTQAGRLAAAPTTTSANRLEILHAGDELGRLAATFNRLLERVEAAGSQLKGFIADAAHELKTPVAVVRAESELALSGERPVEEYRESLAVIAGESARLSRLVGDLTLLAEGQALAHPLERRLVDLVELIHEVRRGLQPLAAARGIRIDVQSENGAEYRGDERLLRQTLTNLIENAVKYSPERGTVRIAVASQDGRREIRVVDAAPTLAPDERLHVFDRFYRSARARSEDATGSGLGLAIVRWAVRLHGGEVRAEPVEPRGNAFVVELPLSPEASAPQPSAR
jgi:signal transduction histidine kinase